MGVHVGALVMAILTSWSAGVAGAVVAGVIWLLIGLSPHLPPPPLQTGSAAWRLADCPEGRIPQGCTALLRFTDDTRRRR